MSAPRISTTIVYHCPALNGAATCARVAGFSSLVLLGLSRARVKPAGVIATRQTCPFLLFRLNAVLLARRAGSRTGPQCHGLPDRLRRLPDGGHWPAQNL